MNKVIDFLNYSFSIGENIHVSIKLILIVFTVILIAKYSLKFGRKFITRKLPENAKIKFISIFSYLRWLIYLIIFLVTLNSVGINVTAVFAASAALLIGIGLALQTLFQDVISGIFILLDQTVHVGDIIELEGKVGRVAEINLRTTRAVTIDNKVLIIPNHLYLTNSLYNWTENGTTTREHIFVGVAYGSDVELVKKVLLEVAEHQAAILKSPEPVVLFTDFAESSLMFKLVFTINNSFEAGLVKSDVRFAVDKIFRENAIRIPFPQRDIHMYPNN